MKVAFVGVRRPYSKMDPGYVRVFSKYHLEIPFYFAEFGGNDITVTTVDHDSETERFASGGSFRNVTERGFVDCGKFDVVVHWREWFPEFWRHDDGAIHLLHTCDHSYPQAWLDEVRRVLYSQLYGIDCYPGWHEENLAMELGRRISGDRLISGYTFGVDTEIYHPGGQKDPRALLWASDPGRGLGQALNLAMELFRRDRRFRLHVCHPDYVSPPPVAHPAVVWHGFVPNGPRLWKVFNETGMLLYTSTFKEPSSRAVRQAQAAGSLVLYPPDMGSPSRYIRDGIDGFVRPVEEWADLIVRTVEDEPTYRTICENARQTAVLESWEVQARRFNDRIGRVLQERKALACP